VPELVACPFCRELFVRGEATVCPACGLRLADLNKLPPSRDALAEEEDPYGLPARPDLDPLAWHYWRRGRGALALIALLGLATFFASWVDMTSPEIREISGFALAKRTGWVWGAGVGWFVLLPMVITRRSIDQMRGARVAAAFLTAVPLVTAVILLLRPPHARYVPVRFDWGWGIFATLVLGVVGTAISVRFGGRVDDITVSRGSSGTLPRLLH
jgi:hypothetical protein